MTQVQIVDSFPNQVVHICIGKQVYHAALSGDSYYAECLETGDKAIGTSRDETLRHLAAKLVRNGFRPKFGVTG